MVKPVDKIFPEASVLRKEGKCPFCEVIVDVNTLKDELSKKEFRISGLCQKCQDDIFNNNIYGVLRSE